MKVRSDFICAFYVFCYNPHDPKIARLWLQPVDTSFCSTESFVKHILSPFKKFSFYKCLARKKFVWGEE